MSSRYIANMSDGLYAYSPSYGWNSGSSFPEIQCPEGEYIDQVTVSGGKYVDSITPRCSDGSSLGRIGGGGGSPITVHGPFMSVDLQVDGGIQKLLGVGGTSGQPGTYTCPPMSDGTPRYVVGVGGRAGTYVDQLHFICAPRRRDFCARNLEHPMCSNIDTDTLNIACASRMTDTCYRRKDELYDDIMTTYCARHPSDPICSCYAAAPDYIPAGAGAIAKCWSSQCVTSGYMPRNMRSTQCPNIKICRQDIGVSGAQNLLTQNVILQDCSDPIIAPSPSVTDTGTTTQVSSAPADVASQVSQGSSSIGDILAAAASVEASPAPESTSAATFTIYIWILVLVVIIFTAISVWVMWPTDELSDEISAV